MGGFGSPETARLWLARRAAAKRGCFFWNLVGGADLHSVPVRGQAGVYICLETQIQRPAASGGAEAKQAFVQDLDEGSLLNPADVWEIFCNLGFPPAVTQQQVGIRKTSETNAS